MHFLELQFRIVSTVALASWILLWFIPRSRIAEKLVLSGVGCLVLSIVYSIKLLAALAFSDLQKFQTLTGVMSFFSSPEAMLVGWVHYLTFDLFVGIWMVRDARRFDVPHAFLIFPLLLTFLTGPLGLLMYVVLKTMWRRNPQGG